MTFTGRMRLALLLLALLPPVVAVTAVWWYSSNRARHEAAAQARSQLERIEQLTMVWEADTKRAIDAAAQDVRFQRAVLQLGRDHQRRPDISPLPGGVDFLELIDSTGTVLASANRPGLIGSRIAAPGDTAMTLLTSEYDLSGRHPSTTMLQPMAGGFRMYAGRFLDTQFLEMLEAIGRGRVALQPVDSLNRAWFQYETGRLYENGGNLEARVLGSEEAGFMLTMAIDLNETQPGGGSLLFVTALVSLVSIIAAMTIGWYLTGKAKREVDNLIEASHRVAAGDFSTPVMAYEEGEFAQLADSLSDMMTNLKRVQKDLATAEKIAAWQAMGRKIAHEVKNPLTPIAISIDDLRRSHAEKLPEFDSILKETTSTIKAEVARLTQLLDQFVAFARMNPPERRERPIADVIERVRALHRSSIEQQRLVLPDHAATAKAWYDIDRIEQVLVNLIKNGLETDSDTIVTMVIDSSSADTMTVRVTDTGPGLPDSVLTQAFEPKVSDKSGGFGLGLVICHRIIHDHGGELKIGNSPDGGAEILFTLKRTHG